MPHRADEKILQDLATTSNTPPQSGDPVREGMSERRTTDLADASPGPALVLAGIDGAYADIYGRIRKDVLKALRHARRESRTRKHAGQVGDHYRRTLVQRDFAGVAFGLDPDTPRGYSFRLVHDDLDILVREQKKNDAPDVQIRLEGRLTWRRTCAELHRLIENLRLALTTSRSRYRVSRAALTADFVNFDLEWRTALDSFATLARFTDRPRSGSGPITLVFGRDSGGSKGRDNVRGRIYRKDLDRKNAPAFVPLWADSPAYTPGAAVTRVEFELNGAARLRKYRVNDEYDCSESFPCLEAGAASIWAYLTTRWLNLRTVSPSGKRTKALDPRWEAIRSVRHFDRGICRVVRRIASIMTAEQALAQGGGLMLRFLAATGYDAHTGPDKFVAEYAALLRRTGRSLETELQRHRHLIATQARRTA